MKTPHTKLSALPATVAACALALLALPSAFANDSDMNAEFKMMDTNSDGQISRAEHAAGARAMFMKMDADHDGVVTASEMTAMHNEKMSDHKMKERMSDKSEKTSAEKISMIDQDGDGRITADEHAKASEMMFDKMDTNGDGMLSKAEMAEGHKMMMKK